MKIEGYTSDEILVLSNEEIEAFAFTTNPVVLRAGTAEVLGQFRLSSERLTVELAQIGGGGEGVLPTLWLLAERLAQRRGITQIEWIVHAVNCASPNLKLRRVLERRGFTVHNRLDVGECFYQLHSLAPGLNNDKENS
jgi:hypothetical protein